MEFRAKKFTLIGPGKVGTSLAYLLQQQGYLLNAVIGRSLTSLEIACTVLGADVQYSDKITKELLEVDFVLIGVKDDQIIELVKYLLNAGVLSSGQILVHLSGVLPAQGNEDQGIGSLALHPLQTVADIKMGITELSQAVWSIEGDALGIELGEELLTSLQAQWIALTAAEKPLYHTAACMVSNYLVTLTQIGMDLLGHLGFSAELAQRALYPLIQGAVMNLRDKPPKEAITGPIARGDLKTINRHLEALATVEPHIGDIYRMLGKSTVQLVQLTVEERDTLTRLLSEGESN